VVASSAVGGEQRNVEVRACDLRCAVAKHTDLV